MIRSSLAAPVATAPIAPRRAPLAPLAPRRAARLLAAALACPLAAAAFAACTDELDEPWELTHARVLAVRATPPAIEPGERATLDALLLTDSRTELAAPDAAQVLSPTSLTDLIGRADGVWTVTAPSAARLAVARAELALPADAPVPLVIQTSFGERSATKALLLGATAANPSLSDVAVGGAFREPDPAPDPAPLALPRDRDVALSVAASPTDSVTWLASTGTVIDFDLPRATLKLEADDPATGELVVILRDAGGGVSWRTWPLRVE